MQIFRRVEELEDAQVVPVLEELYRLAFAAVPYERVAGGLIEGGDLERLARQGASTKQRLSMEQSIVLGRALLGEYRKDPGHAALLEEAITRVRQEDDDLAPLPVILAIGLLVNLTLFVATTETTIERSPEGKIHFSLVKHVASPELVKQVVRAIPGTTGGAH